MFMRFRWFALGAAAATGALAYLAAQVKRARQQITPANLARRGVRSVAGLLDVTADRIDPRTPVR